MDVLPHPRYKILNDKLQSKYKNFDLNALYPQHNNI